MRDPAAIEVKPDLNVTLQENLRRLQSDFERGAILKALESTGGNRAETAALLGISRNTLFKKLRQYGLGKPSS
jgi:transcriptional regulator of acetoin/glycerol metabolism